MKKINNILNKLRLMGVTAVKQSTEDEGSSFNDILLMRKITKKNKLKLNIKIGGCEARNDIFFCKRVKADSIVAPMVETEYALKKFTESASIKKKNLLFFNIETISALKNLNKMLNSKSFNYIDGVVLGRSDLAGSLNKPKNYVNSRKIFNLVENCFKLIKKKVKKKIIFKMGGSITPKSEKFIKHLYQKKLLGYIETRNIEIKLNKKNVNDLDKIISIAFEFEMEWLKIRAKKVYKIDRLLALQYNKRILEIKKRLDV